MKKMKSHIMKRFKSRHRFNEDKDGAATIEFVILFPIFLTMFFWILETGWIAFQIIQLDRGVSLTAREMSIKNITDAGQAAAEKTHNELLDLVCGYSNIRKCKTNVRLEVVAVDSVADLAKKPMQCTIGIDSGSCNDSAKGSVKQIIEVRACLIYDSILPTMLTMHDGSGGVKDARTSGFNGDANAPSPSTTGVRLTSRSVFFNEPC